MLSAVCACSDKDMTPPEIIPSADYTSPLNCQVFHQGGVLPVSWTFTDNVELGSFNIEVHSNHDHHTHSTEAEDCPEAEHEEHAAEGNLWVFNKDYAIPAGSTSYDVKMTIPIPADAAEGEYHFMLRVTDAAGWQQLRSVSIHIENAD